MSDGDRLRALAREHLPDGPASPAEFLAFYRLLLRLAGDDPGDELEVEVVCWLTAGGVHHHVVVRDARTGWLRSQFGVAVAMPVAPAGLHRHAEHVSDLLTAALNLDRSQEHLGDGPIADA